MFRAVPVYLVAIVTMLADSGLTVHTYWMVVMLMLVHLWSTRARTDIHCFAVFYVLSTSPLSLSFLAVVSYFLNISSGLL